jgi:hypothetical protein
MDQCQGGEKQHGRSTDIAELKANLAMNCIPEEILEGQPLDYDTFLDRRRELMAARVNAYFQTL